MISGISSLQNVFPVERMRNKSQYLFRYGLSLLAFFFCNVGVLRFDVCRCESQCHPHLFGKEHREQTAISQESCCLVSDLPACRVSDGEPVETAGAGVSCEEKEDCGCSISVDLNNDYPTVVVSSSSSHFYKPLQRPAVSYPLLSLAFPDASSLRFRFSSLQNNPPPTTLEVCVLTTCLLI